jgi:hypothetical protein
MEKLRQHIKKCLNEIILEQKEEDLNLDYPSFIRKKLKSIYEPLGLWGRAPNPNDDCETNFGVINIFPHSEQDVWSVLNRFDTNYFVEKKLKEWFNIASKNNRSQEDFLSWIEKHKNNLFGPEGKYTQILVNLNRETIDSGNKNEEFAVSVIKERFPNAKVRRFCAGDYRDTLQGIDINVKDGNHNFNIQVKPFNNVISSVSPEGKKFFDVFSKIKIEKYSERNVNRFIFVNLELNKFIVFKNEKSKIKQIASDIVRFYEDFTYTNLSFEEKKVVE